MSIERVKKILELRYTERKTSYISVHIYVKIIGPTIQRSMMTHVCTYTTKLVLVSVQAVQKPIKQKMSEWLADTSIPGFAP